MNRPSPLRPLAPALGLLLLFALPVAPRAQEETAAPAILRPGDALLVRIENLGGGLPEYREIVDAAGQIELPYLGMLDAAGKTLPALQAEMADAYATARLATNATIHITIVTHFEPPPARETLIRSADPRLPVPAADAFPQPSGPTVDVED
jgi:protein involved in polysaccharide export with SLBB domain